jgi:heterodisulfide reductase subunit A-like polyferredoxin
MLKSFYLLILITNVFAKPPVTIDPANPNDDPTLPSNVQRKVLIIGAGLAGLSAAIELADRGYNVTLKEKSDTVGGKLSTRPVQVLNETFYVEHGFHGIKLEFKVL